jgi:hypothetical protein
MYTKGTGYQEQLERAGIYIDYFPVGRKQGTFLLTHLHSDHVRIPSTFEHSIATTSPSILVELFPHVVATQLQLGTWGHTEKGIPYFVLPTEHAPFSCGFYFPTLHIFYLGDGKMTDTLLTYVPRHLDHLTIVYDALFEDTAFGTEDAQCDTLCYALYHYKTLYCRHYGILYYVSKCMSGIRFHIHPTVPRRVYLFARSLDLVDERSEYVLVGPGYQGMQVVPTTLWFRNHIPFDPTYIHPDGMFQRVFINCHSSQQEIRYWKDQVPPQYEFQPLVTRPL